MPIDVVQLKGEYGLLVEECYFLERGVEMRLGAEGAVAPVSEGTS